MPPTAASADAEDEVAPVPLDGFCWVACLSLPKQLSMRLYSSIVSSASWKPLHHGSDLLIALNATWMHLHVNVFF
jgi:hypothetical protein